MQHTTPFVQEWEWVNTANGQQSHSRDALIIKAPRLALDVCSVGADDADGEERFILVACHLHKEQGVRPVSHRQITGICTVCASVIMYEILTCAN